jgi:hypothetical protein
VLHDLSPSLKTTAFCLQRRHSGTTEDAPA